MARLLLLVLTLIGFALTFIGKSTGVLEIGLLLGIVGFFGFVVALAAARVSASARPEASMASVEDIVALRKRPPAPCSSASVSASDPSDRAP